MAEEFPTYRGTAVEPIVREAVERLSIGGDSTFDGARAVGAYWTRGNQVQVGLVGAERDTPPVERVAFVGSIKWREEAPFTARDVSDLEVAATGVPGLAASTRRVAVSRTGFDRRIAAPIRRVEAGEILEAFPAD